MAMLRWLMLGYESWQRKRLRRIEKRATLERMAQRVRDFSFLVTREPQNRRSAVDQFLDGYSRDETICVALSQEPLFFAAKQLGVKLPENCRAVSSSSDDRTLNQHEEWLLRKEIRKQRWKHVLNWPSLVLPIVSAIVSGVAMSGVHLISDTPSRFTNLSDSHGSIEN